MPYAAVNGLTMYYEEGGRPGGPPLVLLHGFTAAADMWAGQLADFGARYRLIIPELRGHGRTNNPGGLAAMNHRQFARDVAALCRALAIEQAVFCGESTGAMLQLTLGLEAPELVRAHVLSGGAYFYNDKLRAWMGRQDPADIIGDLDDARQRHTALGIDHCFIVAEAFCALGAHAHGDDFPEPEELRAISAPVLIIHGDQDFFFPVEEPAELFRLLPNAELCILPSTGHVPPVERPAWFNAIVLDFLARRAS
jgi:pimeloyl-ACP methyl ester carboxylesterase